MRNDLNIFIVDTCQAWLDGIDSWLDPLSKSNLVFKIGDIPFALPDLTLHPPQKKRYRIYQSWVCICPRLICLLIVTVMPNNPISRLLHVRHTQMTGFFSKILPL